MFKNLKKLLLEDNETEEKVEVEVNRQLPDIVKKEVINDTQRNMLSYMQDNRSQTIDTSKTIKSDFSCETETKKVLTEYELHLSKVNQAGYDFYEYYNAIVANDIDNLNLYPIIFSVAQGFDKSLTKENLRTSADFYLNEINKSYINFKTDCTEKYKMLETSKSSEKISLENRLHELEIQIKNIYSEIEDKTKMLQNIDDKYVPDMKKVECFIEANERVKENLTTSINKVKNNI